MLAVCRYVYVSNMSVCLFHDIKVCLSVFLSVLVRDVSSVCMSVCLCWFMMHPLSVCLSWSVLYPLFVCLSVCVCQWCTFCLSVCLYVCDVSTAYLSVCVGPWCIHCLSVCLYVRDVSSACLYVCLSVMYPLPINVISNRKQQIFEYLISDFDIENKLYIYMYVLLLLIFREKYVLGLIMSIGIYIQYTHIHTEGF